MRQYSLTHLSDAALLKDLGTLVAQDRATTASLLAHIAEVDARKLYLPAGYPSMHAYCVDELRLSEDAAFIRIRAARAARLVPALFDAVATGELNVTAVNLLAPHLTLGNAPELIALAARKRDRKSTRLNSSHSSISYAVFCLKKKKKKKNITVLKKIENEH